MTSWARKARADSISLPRRKAAESSANRLPFLDYVEFVVGLQAKKAGFTRNHKGLW
jgi:hypothetical protein